MTHVDGEITSQPECWLRAGEVAAEVAADLPRPGERVAVVGCGTSWFMAMAYAGLREEGGQGETDAFQASEFPTGRHYDRVLAISRSGTTTEIIDLLRAVPGQRPVTLLTTDPAAPAAGLAAATIALPFADERSVLQTRFATSALALLRASLGADVPALAADAEVAVRCPFPADPTRIDQVSFLGSGWTVGLAQEAALKCREAATFWAEAYPAMDYRHGPIAIAGPGRLVWAFGPVPAGLVDQVEATGATFLHSRTHGCHTVLGRWAAGRTASTRWPTWCWPSGSRWPWPPAAAWTPTRPDTSPARWCYLSRPRTRCAAGRPPRARTAPPVSWATSWYAPAGRRAVAARSAAWRRWRRQPRSAGAIRLARVPAPAPPTWPGRPWSATPKPWPCGAIRWMRWPMACSGRAGAVRRLGDRRRRRAGRSRRAVARPAPRRARPAADLPPATVLVRADLGDEAGCLGAALLALDSLAPS